METERPFFDLSIEDDEEGREIRDAIERVLKSGKFIGGEEVERFEEEFSRFTGTSFACSVSSGTNALTIALKSSGLKDGDLVILPSFTFFATAEAVILAGGRCVFCDVDEKTLTMSPYSVEKTLKKLDSEGIAVRFAIPVHLYGRIADMERLSVLFERWGIKCIEDACQSHGARLGERTAGSIGIAGAFSFYPTKNLGGIGEGGAITTSNKRLYERAMLLRDHGQKVKNKHICIGYNARLDAIKAAILRVRLKYLEKKNRERRERALFYIEQLKDIEEIILPDIGEEDENHVFHLFVIRVRRRRQIIEKMKTEGLNILVHYPYTLHRLRVLKELSLTPFRPVVSERASATVLSLPLTSPIGEFFRIREVLKKAVIKAGK